jgi:cation:H+ antiporter
MDIAAYISLMLVLCFFLVKSADLVEGAFVLVARKLNIKPFVIGILVLSLASSLPETAILVSSAANETPGLSVGNLIGATIVLLTLVVAVNVFKHREIPFSGKFGVQQVIVSLLILSLQVVFVADGRLEYWEGLLGVAAFLLYSVYIFYQGTKHTDVHPHAQIEAGQLFTLTVKSLLGIIGLVLFASLLVQVATHTAVLLNVPNSLVGLLILAVGTNLPELTIAFRSRTRAEEELAIGNFIGSAAVNTLLISILALLTEAQIKDFATMVPSIIILASTIILFGILAWTDKRIKREEGMILVGVYLLLLIAEGVALYLPNIHLV